MKFRKYDVVYGKLPDKKGSIQSGYRPCVIIQNNLGNTYSPTLLVIPLTKQIKNLNQPTHTFIKCNENNGLKVDSMTLAEQTTTINKDEVYKVGEIKDRNLQKEIFRSFVYAAAYGNEDADLREIQFI